MAAGVEHYRRGELEAAERALAVASRLDPADARTHNALGVVVAARGRVEAALGHFRAALDADPRSVPAATNLADAALNLGRLDEARRTLDAALVLAPDDAALHALRAETLAAANEPREALASAARWAALAPHEAQAQRALGTLARRIGSLGQALEAFRAARALDAGSGEERFDLQGIAACLEHARFDAADPRAAAEIVECLATPGIESQLLARAAGDLLVAELGAQIDPSVDGQDERQAEHGPDTLARAEAHGWTASALAPALLERAINVDPRLEAALVAIRRALLDVFEARGELPAPWRRLAAAIATQCFLNEHVWPLESEEQARAARHAERLAQGAGTAGTDVPPDLAIVVAMYLPLAGLRGAQGLAGVLAWPDDLGPLVERALREPLVERTIAAEIPRAAIVDEISTAVRGQYEESPYPRWVDLPEPNPEPRLQELADLFPRLEVTPVLARAHRVLIAGCGSGRHPLRVARGSPDARVLAIDLSVASLAYALRRARELGVRNVEFRQLDILDARELDGEFAIIESSGVIHHMREPAEGLAALTGKLAPGGLLKLGLYSRRARRLVTQAREHIAAARIEATPEAIRAFRAALLAGHIEGLEALAESSDLYATSACRDLLFHVQEHQFTPPEIGDLLAGEGLVFLGFQLPGYSALERFRARFPEPGSLCDLACWDRFEEEFPGTFANTFQMWCQKPP